MNPDKLFDYLDGKLSPGERAELEKRFMSDPEVRRELAVARQIHAEMRDSREIVGVAQPTLEERGAVLGRRIAIAFSVLVFANVLFGIYAIAFMKKKDRAQLNAEQNRTELAESLARTAAVALPSESSDLVSRLQARQCHDNLLSGTIDSRDVTIVHTGVGAKDCNERLEALLHKTRPRLVISSGFAGAVSEQLRVGDLIFGEN